MAWITYSGWLSTWSVLVGTQHGVAKERTSYIPRKIDTELFDPINVPNTSVAGNNCIWQRNRKCQSKSVDDLNLLLTVQTVVEIIKQTVDNATVFNPVFANRYSNNHNNKKRQAQNIFNPCNTEPSSHRPQTGRLVQGKQLRVKHRPHFRKSIRLVVPPPSIPVVVLSHSDLLSTNPAHSF